jgi:hypothetical protein
MSAEENMALAGRFMEARVVKRDVAAVEEMLAPTSSTVTNCFPARNPIARIACRGSLLFMPPFLKVA